MNINELMVGDLVYVVRGYDKHLTIEKVKGIIADEDKPYPVTIFTGETVSLNDIKPIPLTEEILVKNGFGGERRSKYFHLYTLEFDTWDFEIYWGSVNGFSYENIKLSYVHQLQHLLRLAGIEKEIEL